MSRMTCQEKVQSFDHLPVELVELRERLRAQPEEIRAELEPLVNDALEDSRFRRQAMQLARCAAVRSGFDMT